MEIVHGVRRIVSSFENYQNYTFQMFNALDPSAVSILTWIKVQYRNIQPGVHTGIIQSELTICGGHSINNHLLQLSFRLCGATVLPY